MDAKPILIRVAAALREHGLEAVMVGNSAAAIQGAPVTTLDIDFFIRKTPGNIAKLKGVAHSLGLVVFRPFYPVSGMFRLSRDTDALQLDFMTKIDGIRSFNGIRSRATTVNFGGEKILVASLPDIIASKRAAGRPHDLAVLHVLEATLEQKKADQERDSRGSQERE